MNQSTYTITIEQIIEAMKAGYPATVIINGEYYDITAEKENK